VERRTPGLDRRKDDGSVLPAERRRKSRRKTRNLLGSPLAEQTRIDVTDEDALSYWTEELGVSTDVLKAAVEKAGPSLKAVRAQLAKS
jgi:hypothetical protein